MGLRVRNLVCYVKGRSAADDFRKQDALENIRASDERSKRRLEVND
jgi:hypothetical protein